MANHKPYLYRKGQNPAVDADFAAAPAFGKVRVGKTHFFWRFGLSRYAIPIASIQRIYRRIQPMHGRLCAGGRDFFIEWMVLVLQDGTEVEFHYADSEKLLDNPALEYMKAAYPQISYTTPKSRGA